MITTGVKTTSGAEAIADQTAEEIAAAQAKMLEEQKAEAARKVSKPQKGTAFFTAFANSKYVFEDGAVAQFRGNEMILEDEKQIAELRKASKSGAPIWEAK
mgnify:CR=1 FL=1